MPYLSCWTAPTPTFLGPVPVRPGEDPKAANRAANAQFRALLKPSDNRADEVLAKLGGSPLTSPFIDALYTMADATAVLTVPSLEFERGDAPHSLHMVGILPGHGTADWRPPAWWAELDGSRPVVVVTQGTLANPDLSALIELAPRGLADRDATVVAALGARRARCPSRSRPTRGPSSSSRSTSCCQRRTCSSPTADSAARSGRWRQAYQVIVAGLSEDKPAVAARVAHRGVGINLNTATPEPEAAALATDTVLKDTAMRDSARKLALEYAAHDPLSEIERLLLA